MQMLESYKTSFIHESSESPFFEGRGKFMHDPIHGLIHVPWFAVEIIDTPQFQRLRDIRQLGACYYIFPGATHNRFEHCIGVSHLAGLMINQFSQRQPELNITQKERDCVRIAGLCHDLGHGMFSHAFEEFISRARPGRTWHHEEASEMMLDSLLDDPHNEFEYKWTLEDRGLIKSLIRGVPRTEKERNRAFLFEIVANKRNSIDVDKFDYLLRDCYNTGVRSSYDCSRLMLFSRVIDNQVCYHQKEVYNLFELFHTRYSLFKNVYTHRTGKAVELMLVDALLDADPVMHISDMIDDPNDYLHLTDALIKQIELSKEPALQKSRDIMMRLRRRDLYKFVDQINLPSSSEIKAFLKDHLTAEKLLECARLACDANDCAFTVLNLSDTSSTCSLSQSTLTLDDFALNWCTVNFAMKDRNPLDFVRVYSKYQLNQAFPVDRATVSYLVPELYEEVLIRVYAKDAKKMKLVQNVFRASIKRLWKKYCGPEYFLSTLEPSGHIGFGDANEPETGGKRLFSASPDSSQANSSTSMASRTPPKKIRAFSKDFPHYTRSPLTGNAHGSDMHSLNPDRSISAQSSVQNSPSHPIKLAPNEALTLPDNYVPKVKSPRKETFSN